MVDTFGNPNSSVACVVLKSFEDTVERLFRSDATSLVEMLPSEDAFGLVLIRENTAVFPYQKTTCRTLGEMWGNLHIFGPA